MNRLILVTILICGVASQNPSSQPICLEEGFYTVPDNCAGFYRCVNFDESYTKFDFQCGPGTMYHPELITCVHPWQMLPGSDCGPDGGNGI